MTEDRLSKLLEHSSVQEMDRDSLLVFLSLINLLSMVDLIEQRVDGKKGKGAEYVGKSMVPSGSGVPGENSSQAKGAAFDPSPILNMLGGKEGSPIDSAQLTDLFDRVMKPSRGVDPAENKEASDTPVTTEEMPEGRE